MWEKFRSTSQHFGAVPNSGEKSLEAEHIQRCTVNQWFGFGDALQPGFATVQHPDIRIFKCHE